MVNVLFVCTANVARSPMAAKIFLELAGGDPPARRGRRHRVVGDATPHHTGSRLGRRGGGDGSRHLVEISNLWPDHASKVRVLEVPDDYDPGEAELRDLLTEEGEALLADLRSPQSRQAFKP